ncbi:hypothetical protein [Prochlorococcus sp. MIT 1306]|uniref:hypothetical protein n=1 Tax=Prochlorococcus sp. MIT 1306 TaxID=1799667 RepID=UPI0007B31F13|nr:hypothetical protein [Prochlorococcus sp. MIT 1306]KZR65027.1 hypothetical protein PMIT1306_00708 [Prochlorococcus sp. MIT 1306]
MVAKTLKDKNSAWLDELEVKWRSLVKEGKAIRFIDEAKDALVERPKNQWILKRIIEILIDYKDIDNAIKFLEENCPSKEILNSSVYYALISKIIGVVSGEKEKYILVEKIKDIESLKGLALAKEAQLKFTKRSNSLSLYLFKEAFSRQELPISSIAIWCQAAVFAEVKDYSNYIELFINEHKKKPNRRLLNNILILSVVAGQPNKTEEIFKYPFTSLLNSWEYLMWFNRIPLKIEVDKEFERAVEKYYKENNVKDCRWLFQYSLILLRKGMYKESNNILNYVNRNHPTLRHLTKPILKSFITNNLVVKNQKVTNRNRMQTISSYIADSDETVLVIFCGWSGAIGYYSADYINQIVSGKRIGSIYLTDPTLNWFSGGISPLGKDVQSCANGLKKLVDNLESSRVIFIGSSVTGLAALHYASYVEPKAVISFAGIMPSSEIKKGEQLLELTSRYKRKGQRSFIRNKKMDNLYGSSEEALVDMSAKNIPLYYVYGSENIIDRATAENLSQYGCTQLIPLKGVDTHSISSYCIGMGIFKRLVNHVIQTVDL